MRIQSLAWVAAALVLPSLALAQMPAPNDHASDTAKAKVSVHRQNPGHPAPEASDVAKDRVAQPSATRVRGSVASPGQHPATPATPAVPAKGATPAVPATPASGGAPAVPATPAAPPVPATPATPASPATPPPPPPPPSQRPSEPGQSGSHRP